MRKTHAFAYVLRRLNPKRLANTNLQVALKVFREHGLHRRISERLSFVSRSCMTPDSPEWPCSWSGPKDRADCAEHTPPAAAKYLSQ